MFLAVGQNGLRMSSPDGAAWSTPLLGKEGEVWRAVACTANVPANAVAALPAGKSAEAVRAVAVGTYGGANILAATTDGKTWTTGTKDGRYVRYIRGLGVGVVEGAVTLVGIGGDPGSVGSSKPFIVTSRDGLAWSDFTDIEGRHILRRIAFGTVAGMGGAVTGLFVGVGDRGRRSSSADAKTWVEAAGTKPLDTLVDVAFGTPGGKGLFVGVGLHGLRMITADGRTWEHLGRGEEGEHLNSVLWTGERFVSIGAGTTWSSADGRTWDRKVNRNAPLTAAHGKVAGKDVYIGSSWKGRMLRSTDAVEWVEVLRAPEHAESLCFAPFGK